MENDSTIKDNFEQHASQLPSFYAQIEDTLSSTNAQKYITQIQTAAQIALQDPTENNMSMANTIIEFAQDAIKQKQLSIFLSGSRSHHRERAEQYKKLAVTDKLTGIPNLQGYQKQIETAIKLNGTDIKRPDENIPSVGQRDEDIGSPTPKKIYSALVLFDLDRFKGVNDEHGHVAGDRMLQEFVNDAQKAIFADVLTDKTRKDTSNLFDGMGRLARIGGDEFSLIMTTEASTNEEAKEHFQKGLERILTHLNAIHVKFDDKCFPIISSAGMHIIEDGDTPEIAKTKADEALYEHKKTKDERREYAMEKLKERGLDPVVIEDIRAKITLSQKQISSVLLALQEDEGVQIKNPEQAIKTLATSQKLAAAGITIEILDTDYDNRPEVT